MDKVLENASVERICLFASKFCAFVTEIPTQITVNGGASVALTYLKQVFVHEVMVRLWMLPRQADIFVHVEGLDILETDFSSFVVLHKLGIHLQGGTT